MNQTAGLAQSRPRAYAPVLELAQSPSEQRTTRRRRTSVAGLAPASLGWGLALFALGQALLSLALYVVRPDWRDPEYGRRLHSLKEQMRAAPQKPLIVVLGSSRVAMGFRPDVLENEPESAIVANFATLGAGPILELVWLERLLADGVKPQQVLIECWAPFWHQKGAYSELARFDPVRFDGRDRRILGDYYPDSTTLTLAGLQGALLPAYSHRFTLLSQLAPGWINWTSRRDEGWTGLDQHGWLARPDKTPNPAARALAIESYRTYFTPLLDEYELAEQSDRALRAILTKCRDRGIRVGLFHMPEGSEFRSWYPPGLIAATERHMDELGKEYGAVVVSAREWMRDEDFQDSSHLTPSGAAAFTRRFGEQFRTTVP